MRVLKIREDARLPEKKREDMCYDLFACFDGDYITVEHGRVTKVPTGIKIALPEGYHASVRPRSGLAAKYGLDVLAGQIDGSYKGEWLVLLTTHQQDMVVNIKNGDKIAQFKLEKDETFDVEQVFSENDLGTSERMDKGFGSSDA